jgi:erythromycin esterase
MCDDGTVNVGQIINEEHKPEEVFSVGFGSTRGRLLLDVSGGCYAGYAVPEAVKHSWEYELHKLEAKDRIVFMTEAMREPLRAGIWASRDRGCVST